MEVLLDESVGPIFSLLIGAKQTILFAGNAVAKKKIAAPRFESVGKNAPIGCQRERGAMLDVECEIDAPLWENSVFLRCADGHEISVPEGLAAQIPCSAQQVVLPCTLVQLAQVLQVLKGEAERSQASEETFLALGFEPQAKQHLHFVPNGLEGRRSAGCGALVSLAAEGPQNIYSQGRQYRKTYGRDDERVPERQDRYAEDSIALLDEPLRFNSSKSIAVSRNGDGWGGLLAKITLPALPQGLRWRSDIAEQVVRCFDMQVGGISVYNCSGPLNAAVCTAFGKWPLEQSLRYVNQLSEQERYARSRKPWLLMVPLLVPPMWHDSNLLQLISLQYHEVRIIFELAALERLVCGAEEGTPLRELRLDAHIHLEADYVYEDGELRANMAQGMRATKEPIAAVEVAAVPCKVLAHTQVAEVDPPRTAEELAAVNTALGRWCQAVSLGEEDARALCVARPLTAASLTQLLDALSPSSRRICAAIAQDPRTAQLWSRYAAPQVALLEHNAPTGFALQATQAAPPKAATPLSQGGSEQFLPQIQWDTFELDTTTPTVKRFPLNFNHPCSLIVVAFRCTDDDVMMEADAHPFQSMQLQLNNHGFQSTDAIKAHEWNWKKCEAVGSPAPHQKFYLLPFSKHALRWDKDGFPCTTNMSRIDSLTIQVDPNTALPTHWEMQIGTASQNIFRQLAGMGGTAFSR